MNHPLPPHDPSDPRDELPGEAELRALYRKLPEPEPSAALDDAVRRLASAAVPATARPRARWPAALATAAVLMLAVGLGWQMREKPSAGDKRGALQYTSPGDTVITRPPAPAPPALQAKAAPDIGNASREVAAPLLESFDARTTPKPFPSTLRPSATVSDKPAASTRAIARRLSPDMIAAPAPPAPPAPPTAVEPTTPSALDTPEQQLDRIRRLFAQGRADEARQRLAAFHHEHPAWKLPPELRTELRRP